MKNIAVVSLVLFLSLFASAETEQASTPIAKRDGFDWSGFEQLAIQDRGRIKPLETFAEESVRFITGKGNWKGLKPTEVLFNWLFTYDGEWAKENFIKIGYRPLKQALGVDQDQQYFSPDQLMRNEPFRKILRDAAQKEQRREKLSDIERKLVEVQNQRGLLEAVVVGSAWTILPNPQGNEAPWFSIASLTDQSALGTFSNEQVASLSQSMRAMIDAFAKKDATAWNQASGEFIRTVRNDLAPKTYPSEKSLKLEQHYLHLRPFRVSWGLYVFGFLSLLAAIFTKKSVFSITGISALGAGLLLHTYGFVIRCLIAGRPPVTNMYESVIWVTWGCMLFGFIIWGVYRNNVVLASASVFAAVGLILADTLPSILDPAIHPLEPVLRSNFWLTIHVLTITLSYAAFALSLCLGNVVLGSYIFKTKKGSSQQYSLYMYRAVQVGVVLLAAGTILGGVWADYSWGRFWGWDPKEVWALIALLLYIAVLHGRFTGWLRGFGFAASIVVSFLGVLMAWYGVNFVLGAGLHSYGFGAGGTEWVVGFVALQLAYIGYSYAKYRAAVRAGKIDPTIFPRAR